MCFRQRFGLDVMRYFLHMGVGKVRTAQSSLRIARLTSLIFHALFVLLQQSEDMHKWHCSSNSRSGGTAAAVSPT